MEVFLETQRLILKTPEFSDFNYLLNLRTDLDVMQYTGEGGAQTKEQVKDYLDFLMNYYNKNGLGFFSVFEKTTGNFIGEAGLFHFLFDDTQPDIEINYHLHKKFWGKGYATELVKALVQWGFKHLPIHKLVATSYPENIASQKVLKKAGFDFKFKKQLPDEKEIFWYETYKNDGIELVSYNLEWPRMAESEIRILRTVLPPERIIDIQHVGSTAIPGMIAKPIIDIQIATDSLQAISEPAIQSLTQLGYQYWYDNPDPTRMFFVKGMPPFGEKRTHHVHVVEPSSRHWLGKIQFRDYLCTHPEAVREYEGLKTTLAAQYQYDREQYTDSKTEFVNSILKKAQAG